MKLFGVLISNKMSYNIILYIQLRTIIQLVLSFFYYINLTEVKILSKKKRNKFYAIKVGKDVENIIVKSWDECSKLVLGFNSTYKSFYTEEEAKEYLYKDIKEINKPINIRNKKGEEFVDFSLKRETFRRFEAKCREYGMHREKVLKLLVEEWIED